MSTTINEVNGICYRDATPPEHPKIKWRGFQPGKQVVATGTSWSTGGRKTTCDIILERDVAVKLRDGITTYLDVYRPVTDKPLPAIVCWSPYGKQGSYQEYDNYPARAGVPESATSGLGKSEWEGCDPAYFCANDYVVVCPDPRGAFESEGNLQFFSQQEGLDGHDVIEWVAAQEWCADAVTLAGNSWLTVSQWIVAATKPPHLKCIAPWEGFTDLYRDYLYTGGIPRPYMINMIVETNPSRNQVEDPAAMMKKYPFMNDYWRGKRFDTADINVPAYVVASWTNMMHTDGTLRQYQRLDKDQTWLRVHNTQEWPDQYEYESDLLKFFDHFLKNKQNGWEQTPRVRLSVLDPGSSDIVNRPELEYPLARNTQTKLFLNAANRTMAATVPVSESSIGYEAANQELVFNWTVNRDLEVVGPMKLRVWLETDLGYEADVFVYIRKADSQGSPLLVKIPPGMPWQGAPGRLRASHREVDTQLSTELVPVLSHERPQFVVPGEPMALDIPIWPMAMRFHAGEQLQVVITGHPLDAVHPADAIHQNIGNHIIRTGDQFDSYLLVLMVEL